MQGKREAMRYTLFTYGTLCLPEVMEKVAGDVFVSEAAWLPGYQRFPLRGHVYPGMVYTGRSGTSGRVYHDIDRKARERIDAFEGGYYRCETVRPQLHSGAEIEAAAYVLVDSLRYLLGERDWDETEFRRRYLPRYLRKL